MTQSKKLNFIIIDDSPLDCFIAEKVIKNTGLAISIKSFNDAVEALRFISEFANIPGEHTVVFVDIQMPVMNGFGFVEAFEKLPMQITSQYSIFMISSSINDADLNRVNKYPSIKQFLNKPMTSNNISLLLTKD